MDHYTIWSPVSVRRALAPFGFRPVHVRVTGHHPERSPLLRRVPRIGAHVSGLLGLGDTFEVYAVKTRALASRPGECVDV